MKEKQNIINLKNHYKKLKPCIKMDKSIIKSNDNEIEKYKFNQNSI